MGRDNHVPPLPGRPRAHQAHTSRAHANKPTPEREHASKQAGARERRDHTAPPPPSKRTHQSTQTPKRTRPARKHETQPPDLSKHAHNKPQQGTPPSKHKERPRQSAWASKMCERRRTRVPWQGRPARSKAGETPTRAGTQDKRTQGERANNVVCAEAVPPCARPTGGGEPRAKGRSQ